MPTSAINITKKDIEDVIEKLTLAYLSIAKEFLLDIAKKTEHDAFEMTDQEAKDADHLGIYGMIMHFIVDLSVANDYTDFFFMKLQCFENDVNNAKKTISREPDSSERIFPHAKNKMESFFNMAKKILSPLAPEMTVSSNRSLDDDNTYSAQLFAAAKANNDNDGRRPSITDGLLGKNDRQKKKPCCLQPIVTSY